MCKNSDILIFNLNEKSDTPAVYDVHIEVIYDSERHSIRCGTRAHLKEMLLPMDVYIDKQIIDIIRRLTAHFCFTGPESQPDIIMICHKDARVRKVISCLLPYMIYKVHHFWPEKINYSKVRYMVVPAVYAVIEDISIKARLYKWIQTGYLKIKRIIEVKMSRIPIIPIQRYYRDIERKNKQIVELNHIYNILVNNDNIAGAKIQKEEHKIQNYIIKNKFFISTEQYKIANHKKDEEIRNMTISIDVFRNTIINEINNIAKDEYYQEMYWQYLIENSSAEIIDKVCDPSKFKSIDEMFESFNLSYINSDYWILLGAIYYTEDDELIFGGWDFRTGPPDYRLVDLANIPTKVLYYVLEILRKLPSKDKNSIIEIKKTLS